MVEIRPRRKGFAAVLAAALAGVGLAVAAPTLAHRALFPGDATPFPPEPTLGNLAPGARVLAPPRARVAARSAGPTWRAVVVPARGTRRARVVYLHATNQSAADGLLFAADLSARGLDVLLPEHRGYGGLPGRPSVPALIEDAEAAIDAAGWPPGETVLVGRSLGAATATALAARGRGRALVLLSPFARLDDLAGPARIAFAREDRVDLERRLVQVEVPVTVLHGTRDRLIPFHMGRSLAERSGAAFVPLPGAGHNDLFLPPARAAVLDAIVSAASGRG